jgi:membrane fusion protein (multidrug efflux system)
MAKGADMSEVANEVKPEAKPGTVTTPATMPAKPTNSKGRGRAFLIFFIILAVLATAGIIYWLHVRQFEETDDAEVEAHLNPVAARIDGTVTRVYVDDNVTVKVGDPLVDLDPRDFQVQVDQAKAQLEQARSLVQAQRPNIPITQVQNLTGISTADADVATARAAEAVAESQRATAEAKLAETKANYSKALQDLERDKILIAKEEISQQEYDQADSAAKAQAAAVQADEASLQAMVRTVEQKKSETAAAVSRLNQARSNAPALLSIRRATVVSDEASAANAKAELEQAELKLSYTKITAPVAGIVMKRSAEVGSRISAGQQLMTIAQVDDLWITANYKETQLENIRAGQSASIHVDALKKDFEGYVEDIGASTGAISSVLPPENATGNFVKIVQRIPVRLRFKKGQAGLEMLRPGMSVVPEIRIGK